MNIKTLAIWALILHSLKPPLPLFPIWAIIPQKELFKLINISEIDFSYASFSPKVLSTCSANFDSNSVNLILGENGSGKSTLMDVISGFKRPQNGTVIINRVEMYKSSSTVTSLRKIISYMPSALKLPPHLDVEYILSLWMGAYKANELIELLNINNFIGHRYLHLSDGYKTRVHLAIALSKGSVVLLDEPLKSQDEELCNVFPKLLEISSKGRTIIVSSPISIDGVNWASVRKIKGGKLL